MAAPTAPRAAAALARTAAAVALRSRAMTTMARRGGHAALRRQERSAAPTAWPRAARDCRRSLVAAGPGCMRAYSQQQQAAESKIWDFEGLQKLISNPDSKVVIVDAREPAELEATGRIPGAINIPIKSAPDSFHIGEEEFEDKFGFPRPSQDQELVFYCKAGVRSRAAAGLARQSGWKNLGEYPGSWVDWESHGGKTQK
ncbi:uncharacterized protein E0L32_004801 [Thyridium curvatum]|uniref:Rhodanese domain-containing protein n=1 Tax=Thyridium curvatum TaxID=1093900 RepID=A0A507BDH5_9PEZI|nr:uncharacterized protein E0L32_004801 [Thyridium curvatum]TPX14971.1 hypothetical protein E0L32_004801 [Thyridium curvatum]